MPHRCPNYCHLCPDMKKAIIEAGRTPTKYEHLFPFCYANMHYEGFGWKDNCNCEQNVETNELRQRLNEIEKEAEEIKRLLKKR